MAMFRIGQQIAASGAPLAGGRAYFRVTGTTTPAMVYADADLTDPLPYPVVADGAGRFPAVVYFSDAVALRYDLIAVGGDLNNPLESADPINTAITGATVDGAADIVGGSIPGTAFDDTAIADSLGYTPADIGGDTFTGPVRLDYVPTTIPDDLAGFRIAPVNLQDADYTLTLDDVGRAMSHSSATPHAWTIPLASTVAIPAGAVIVFANSGSGAITFTREGGVSLRIGGAATDQNVAVAQWGGGSLLKIAADSWIAFGIGLS